jgi:hypothetical protein
LSWMLVAPDSWNVSPGGQDSPGMLINPGGGVPVGSSWQNSTQRQKHRGSQVRSPGIPT